MNKKQDFISPKKEISKIPVNPEPGYSKIKYYLEKISTILVSLNQLTKGKFGPNLIKKEIKNLKTLDKILFKNGILKITLKQKKNSADYRSDSVELVRLMENIIKQSPISQTFKDLFKKEIEEIYKTIFKH